MTELILSGSGKFNQYPAIRHIKTIRAGPGATGALASAGHATPIRKARPIAQHICMVRGGRTPRMAILCARMYQCSSKSATAARAAESAVGRCRAVVGPW